MAWSHPHSTFYETHSSRARKGTSGIQLNNHNHSLLKSRLLSSTMKGLAKLLPLARILGIENNKSSQKCNLSTDLVRRWDRATEETNLHMTGRVWKLKRLPPLQLSGRELAYHIGCELPISKCRRCQTWRRCIRYRWRCYCVGPRPRGRHVCHTWPGFLSDPGLLRSKLYFPCQGCRVTRLSLLQLQSPGTKVSGPTQKWVLSVFINWCY